MNRLLFGAPSSGGGKTTVVCGILKALIDRGEKPLAFKCGPDYIDPMFHSEIIGAMSRNLDLFFMGSDVSKQLLAENSKKGTISIIEGVMGYYDGIAMSDKSSAFDLATETETPVVFIADARGRALSVAALINGFVSFRQNSNIKGVILNRISPMMYDRLKETIETECGIKVYGFLPNCPEATLESRHLGLVTAAEVDNLKEKVAKLGELVEKYVDLDGLLELSKTANPLEIPSQILPKPLKKKVKIAVAKDKAFCFYYADSLELMEKLGAEIVEFSPLNDEKLPENISGLYLGGGYPEVYSKALSDNKTMLENIKKAIENELPTIAECGGFMYLHEEMEGSDGVVYEMVGAVSGKAFKTEKLQRFGYITLKSTKNGLLGNTDFTMPGHEFHYWDSTNNGSDFKAEKPLSNRTWDCAHMCDTLYAGFPHFHFCACPEACKNFLISCEKYGG